MKKFLDDDFLLETETAKKLYEIASRMPIYDYHCHLSAQKIYEDHRFDSITDLWLVDGMYGDHYKWRAMRGNGVAEDFITGNRSKKEKFLKWAETVPYTLGNPLYHWTHLELRRYFGIEKILNETTAEEIYEEVNEKLKTLSCRKIIEMSAVDTICTTDDPIDSLEFHRLLAEDRSFFVHVYPTFRPDRILKIEQSDFLEYLRQLASVTGIQIIDFSTLKRALISRIDYFHRAGCRISDHSLEQLSYESYDEEEIERILKERMRGNELSSRQISRYRTALLVFLGKEYAARGWVMQYHINALRNNNSRMAKTLGPDTGYDSVDDRRFIRSLAKILDEMERTHELPKTILYSLNAADYESLCTLAYCFQESGIHGKVQLGSGWWFHDQKDGILRQLSVLSNMGLLSNFIGMLTDSRSFLSYTRHEYFRRILCNFIGNLVESGEYPDDGPLLKEIVENICFYNAKRYFDADRAFE